MDPSPFDRGGGGGGRGSLPVCSQATKTRPPPSRPVSSTAPSSSEPLPVDLPGEPRAGTFPVLLGHTLSQGWAAAFRGASEGKVFSSHGRRRLTEGKTG